MIFKEYDNMNINEMVNEYTDVYARIEEAKIMVVKAVASAVKPFVSNIREPMAAKPMATPACGIKPRPKKFLVLLGALVISPPK